MNALAIFVTLSLRNRRKAPKWGALPQPMAIVSVEKKAVNPGGSIVYTLVASPGLRDIVHASAWSGGFRPVALDSARDDLCLPDSPLPACLILSVDLPGMSDADLQARIASDAQAIVLVSAVDFLTVPLDPRELVRAIHNAIELDARRRAARARTADLERRYRTLTARECELFALITEGLLNKQAASVLGISPMTVQIHRGRIMRKMAARSFAELVRFADALNISQRAARPVGAVSAASTAAAPADS
jgi:FixJ family two-component response regulator